MLRINVIGNKISNNKNVLMIDNKSNKIVIIRDRDRIINRGVV
jgi:hypothetical protein